MSVVAIVQARMGSTRLPGKVLMDLAGRPMLAHVIHRAAAIHGVDQVVVATTTAPQDQPILRQAPRWGAIPFAGSEADVLDRFYHAARSIQAAVIVRITADCPLLDPDVSSAVLAHFFRQEADYATNTQPPTFPDGLDTEVLSFAALERAWREAVLPSEREHVTPYLWKHPDRFRLANLAASVDHAALRWTVDEPQDLAFVRAIYARLYQSGRRPFGMADVLALLAREPALQHQNAGFARNAGYYRSVQHDHGAAAGLAGARHVGEPLAGLPYAAPAPHAAPPAGRGRAGHGPAAEASAGTGDRP